MKSVKVLGPGCKRCQATAEMVRAEADRLGIAINLEKVTDYTAIAGYGIVSTPGLVIDGKVLHAGGLPKPEDIAKWLAACGTLRPKRSVVTTGGPADLAPADRSTKSTASKPFRSTA